MAKVGIICAGERELAPFLPHIARLHVSKRAMLTLYEGEIDGTDVIALFCGVCKVNAAVAAQLLIDCRGVDVIINAGTCGGIDERLDVLDTVVCTEVMYHDMDNEILTGYHPWMPDEFFKADGRLLELARRAATTRDGKIYFGRMVTGESFIDIDGRDEIIAACAPLSVDMETAAIAHVCYVNGVPFIAVRTLTDTAKHSGEANFEKNCAEASSIAKDFVRALLERLRQE